MAAMPGQLFGAGRRDRQRRYIGRSDCAALGRPLSCRDLDSCDFEGCGSFLLPRLLWAITERVVLMDQHEASSAWLTFLPCVAPQHGTVNDTRGHCPLPPSLLFPRYITDG